MLSEGFDARSKSVKDALHVAVCEPVVELAAFETALLLIDQGKFDVNYQVRVARKMTGCRVRDTLTAVGVLFAAPIG